MERCRIGARLHVCTPPRDSAILHLHICTSTPATLHFQACRSAEVTRLQLCGSAILHLCTSAILHLRTSTPATLKRCRGGEVQNRRTSTRLHPSTRLCNPSPPHLHLHLKHCWRHLCASVRICKRGAAFEVQIKMTRLRLYIPSPPLLQLCNSAPLPLQLCNAARPALQFSTSEV